MNVLLVSDLLITRRPETDKMDPWNLYEVELKMDQGFTGTLFFFLGEMRRVNLSAKTRVYGYIWILS
jgi:hypothetical protein